MANNPNVAFVALFPAGTTQAEIDAGATALNSVSYRSAGFPDSVNGASISLTDVSVDNTDGANWTLIPSDGSCEPYGRDFAGYPMYGNPGRNHEYCATPYTPVCLCGDLTWVGECSGDEVSFCVNMTEPTTIDCVAEFGPGATCGLLDCSDPDCLGFYCVAKTGEDCGQLWCDATLDPDPPHAPEACLSGVCADSTSCDPGSFSQSCSGDVLSFCHTDAQVVWEADCSAGSAPYACGTTYSGAEACLGLEGGACDYSNARECAPGFRCIDGICTLPAGVGESVPEPCAGLTHIGECDGDTLRYCAESGLEILKVDCVDEFGPSATCGLLDCTDADCLGYYCVAKIGEDCDQLWCDAESGLGCVWGICDNSFPCVPGSFNRSCTGDRLTYCHPTALLEWELDCSEGGTEPYICGMGSLGDEACLGLKGAVCDHGSGRECQSGLVCLGGICTERASGTGLESEIFGDGFESNDTLKDG